MSGRSGRDVEELREVLSVVAEFIDKMKTVIKEALEAISSSLDGRRIGEEVAAMYKSLVEAGMPPEQALQLTEKFLNAKLEAVPKISSLIEALQKAMSGGRGPMPTIIVGGPGAGRTRKTAEIRVDVEEEEGSKQPEGEKGGEGGEGGGPGAS